MVTTQLELGVDVEPLDPIADTKATIESVIRYVAITHGGVVSSNTVREHLVGHIPREHHKAIGQVYRDLVRTGRMARDGYEHSTDVAGGNAGRLVPVYRWTEVAA